MKVLLHVLAAIGLFYVFAVTALVVTFALKGWLERRRHRRLREKVFSQPFIPGTIQYFRAHPRALTPEEVEQHYKNPPEDIRYAMAVAQQNMAALDLAHCRWGYAAFLDAEELREGE